MFPFNYIYRSHAGCVGVTSNLHLLPQPDSVSEILFILLYIICIFFLLSSSKLLAMKQLTRPHTLKLNHHLIKSIHIQLTGSVFVQRPRTPDLNCDYI